ARDALGMFGAWGAFRDAAVPRCYAIAASTSHRGNARHRRDRTALADTPYADIATWPRRAIRGQFHVHLGRQVATATLSINGEHFRLAATGADAWAADARMDAAITAAMRSASGMSISAKDASGRSFAQSWSLDGAATAMDAALLGCARS
ncbi:MAG TPA: hypothetical protein VN222_13880, partial [Novosphingobium sp.]|nr:hypothetical protein [Novosphingobium sp.]